MSILIKKLIVFIVIVYILDFTIGSIMEYLYFTEKSIQSVNNKLDYCLNKTNEDILIFGASTACHGYIPSIIRDSLKVSCYNVGYNAANMYFYYAILQSTLQRYSPKVIILNINYYELAKAKDDFDKLTDLFPFYYSNPSVREIINLSGKIEQFKMVSKLYRYNSQLLFILKQNIITPTYGDKGYIPLYGNWNNDLESLILDIPPYDSLKLNYFNKFLSLASNNGIRVIVVTTANFIEVLNSNNFEMDQFIYANELEYWNFMNDTTFINHKEYYQDVFHLNHIGATEFTKEIIERLNTN